MSCPRPSKTAISPVVPVFLQRTELRFLALLNFSTSRCRILHSFHLYSQWRFYVCACCINGHVFSKINKSSFIWWGPGKLVYRYLLSLLELLRDLKLNSNKTFLPISHLQICSPSFSSARHTNIQKLTNSVLGLRQQDLLVRAWDSRAEIGPRNLSQTLPITGPLIDALRNSITLQVNVPVLSEKTWLIMPEIHLLWATNPHWCRLPRNTYPNRLESWILKKRQNQWWLRVKLGWMSWRSKITKIDEKFTNYAVFSPYLLVSMDVMYALSPSSFRL